MTTFKVDIKIVLLICLVFVSFLADQTFGHPVAVVKPLQTIFNVLAYGAKPDGKTDSTNAFQAAWEATCKHPEPARLVIPGGVFLVRQVKFEGPCNNKSPIYIQLRGIVKASIDTSTYTEPEWITFEKIVGLNLNGGGTFDGQGPAVWPKHDCMSQAKCASRAINLKFRNITNARIGRITSKDPKGFHMCINGCNNFRAKALEITAPGDSPNTDGIHVSHSNDVTIAKSVISTGDDCISIIQGVNRIKIADVVCGPGHGISVGSLGKYKNEEDVHDVLVKNCTLIGTKNGVRIKTWPDSPPSAATNITFTNIKMENVTNPIIIDQNYCASAKSCRGNKASNVKISQVKFNNIRGTTPTECAVKMHCSPSFPCQNVQVSDINLKYVPVGPTNILARAISECANIRVAVAGFVIPPLCK
ncbi:Exopolygalacturonase [Thalictrum thalictroides]|uniref:Exopolygalacturonase n=1 Tax=Thalictrum thalictroides TaxID=46969 RepID=A0A7J6V2Y4_THATH|nr:Exopolygalacturonase [Thalictrum thalictroides]